MTRYIGIDLGSRRVGLALSDSKASFATPFMTLSRSSDELDAQAIAELAHGEGATTAILGMPFRMDGTKGEASVVVEDFAAALRTAGLRVRFVDERLTTVEATKKLRSTGMKGKKIRQVVDRTAATIILQTFLDTK
jgi:putative Holliday junction resolvase